MKRTPNLNLPIYNTPETDRFLIEDLNTAYSQIDYAYGVAKEIPNVNASAEVADARLGEENLGIFNRKIKSQLEDKANLNEVVKRGYGTLSDFDEETRRVLQGLEQGQINAVLGYKNVTPENSNFIKTGRNKFNPNEVQFYKTIDSLGNIIDSSTKWTLSGKIYAENESDFVFSYVNSSGQYIKQAPTQISFYNENGEFISKVTYVDTCTIPPNCSYFIFVLSASFADNDSYRKVCCESGTTISSFEPFYYILDEKIKIPFENNNIELKIADIQNQLNTNILNTTYELIIKSNQVKLIGDSITHGVGGTGFTNDSDNGELIINVPTLDTSTGGRNFYVNTNGHCWANKIKNYLTEKFNCTVKNWGTRGISATWYISHNMLPTLIEDSDDLVIMMIGTNDRLHATNLSTFLYYLKQVVEYITITRNKKLIIVSSIPSSIDDEINSNKRFHMEDVNNVIMYVSKFYNLPFISLYNEFLQYCDLKGVEIDTLLSDGLHPNDEGYNVMYKIMLTKLGFAPKRNNATW